MKKMLCLCEANPTVLLHLPQSFFPCASPRGWEVLSLRILGHSTREKVHRSKRWSQTWTGSDRINIIQNQDSLHITSGAAVLTQHETAIRTW